MKVCKKHVQALRRGMTYQVVSEGECEICKLLDKHEW